MDIGDYNRQESLPKKKDIQHLVENVGSSLIKDTGLTQYRGFSYCPKLESICCHKDAK